MYSKAFIKFSLIFLLTNYCFAQDSLLNKLIADNVYTFQTDSIQFSGAGWELIEKEVAKSANVLIGEEHCSNEIPFFTKAIYDLKKFDNFFVETDPYTTEILQKLVENKPVSQYLNKEVIPLFVLKPEYELIKHIVNSGSDLMGAEQIISNLDQVILSDLLLTTNNQEAKKIYTSIIENCQTQYNKFLAGLDPESRAKALNDLYFMKPEFMDQINELEKLELSNKEKEVIRHIKIAREIYEGAGVELRIKVFKDHLMKSYPKWGKADNLFKYGAVHMTRGESLASIHDIGNMVANITDSNYEQSFHIMVAGESGELGAPLKGFPKRKMNIDDWPGKSFKPFYEHTSGDDWHIFDLRPLRKKIEYQKLSIEDYDLFLVIKGYDALVIIPELTPAGFNKNQF